MSGHNKWSTIKHKKAKMDAQRGKLFTKLIRQIMIAARDGGGDPDSNSTLRLILDKAREANMPKDTIERAIKRGTGEIEGANYEEILYEGYGPGGVAVMVYCVTDNRNRTVSEVRHIFSKYGGNLGENGCVSWVFEKKGFFLIKAEGKTDEEIIDIIIDSGAEDYSEPEEGEEKVFEVYCAPEDFSAVKEALEGQVEILEAKLDMVPKNTVKLEGKKAKQMLNLIEKLEESDDVQDVYSNYEIDDAVLEEIANG